MELVGFLVVAYMLAGLVRVLKDFASKDVESAPQYVLRRNWIGAAAVALLWPVFPIYGFVERRRRNRLP